MNINGTEGLEFHEELYISCFNDLDNCRLLPHQVMLIMAAILNQVDSKHSSVVNAHQMITF